MDNIIEVKKMSKKYKMKNNIIEVLNDVNLSFESGKFYLITGPSGSGKTSLINILGLLDKSFLGDYYFHGKSVKSLKAKEILELRKENIGFVFQSFYLEPNLSAVENVCLPMLVNKKIKTNERIKMAEKLLELVHLQDRINHKPNELSGGEQQRVCIARALVNNPSILLCDEPTGNLDEKNEKEIFEILKKMSNSGKCVIVVSHSSFAKKYADKIIKISKGEIKYV